MASLMMFGMSQVRAGEPVKSTAMPPPLSDLEFLLFLANGVEEDGQWISELDLENVPLDPPLTEHQHGATIDHSGDDPILRANGEEQP